MNFEEAREQALEELTADYIHHGAGRLRDTILDLIEWSHQQTVLPSVEEQEVTDEG